MNSRELYSEDSLSMLNKVEKLCCSYSLRGCWWPNCRWSQCILSEPVPKWLSLLSSAPCTLLDKGQRKGCSSTYGTEHSHMYTKPHDKQKPFIHTCCKRTQRNVDMMERFYSRW